MQVKEVLSGNDTKEFIRFPKVLYKDDKNWVCPLDSMVESVFDQSKNSAFRNGKARRWLLTDENGTTIGRIAAFIDNVRSASFDQPTGGIGFFEVIEDQEAAFMLFDTAREWLVSEGIMAIDGPINFGENDNNWGLLVEGFVMQSYGMPYHQKYYREFFENYGFRNYFEQYSFQRAVRDEEGKIVEFPERIMRIAEWISKRAGYSFRHLEMNNIRKYAEDFCYIYNSTWTYLKEDFTPIKPEVLEATFMESKPIIDEELIWFAYHDDKPAGFFVLLPDFNLILRHFNGEMNLVNKLRFLWYKTTHEMTRMRAIVGGVQREHQNSGIESAIFLQLYHVFKRKPWYRELELSWVGDYNPKMLAIYEALGAKKAKVHITYRYLIDRRRPFTRYVDEVAEKQVNKYGSEKNKQ